VKSSAGNNQKKDLASGELSRWRKVKSRHLADRSMSAGR